MKYFILAGEKSGDMHAANLAKALFEKDLQADIVGWGGENMELQGVKVLKNYHDLAFMGFWEVFKNIFKIFGFFKLAKLHILNFQPDKIILVDYAGFNLRILKWAFNKGFNCFYYIAPKAWAWQAGRAKILAKYVEKLLVIFPFEVSFFKKYKINTVFVGNPLFDEISNFQINLKFKEQNQLDSRPIIALLPGSRKQEIQNMMDVMFKLSNEMTNYQFVVAGMSKMNKDLYGNQANLKVVFDQTYDLLSNAYAAIVTSGTATLETALFNVPQLVVYKSSFISYQIAKSLIKVPYISLVNLVAEAEVVKELIQNNYNLKVVSQELEKLISNDKFRKNQLARYADIKEKLGKTGASEIAANEIINQT